MKEYSSCCMWCKKEFLISRSYRKRPYCSEECKLLFRKNKHEAFYKNRLESGMKICSMCKVEKLLSEYSGSTHMYCKTCYAAWKKDQHDNKPGVREKAIISKRDNKGKDYNSFLCCNFPAIRSRAKKAGIPFTITREDVIELAENQEFKCALTGRPLSFTVSVGTKNNHNASVDRIIPKLGYVKENIQLVCYCANVVKLDFTMEELYSICEDILNNKNNKK